MYQQYNIVPEVFWLDAGWFEGCGWNKNNGSWWANVGNWTPAKERFPNGLRPVADAIHAAGARFLVWFEPERVRPQSMFDREHPEWLIKLPGRDDYLFDLGNKDACNWLTDYISDFIKKEGIDCYRQDFNFDPYPYWTANDKPGRTGISEIRHIEGLYAFWDSLRVRFPNLLIDNCASGGRRLDIETASRSVPLWRTDYQYFEPNGQQCHTYSLNFYLPLHSTGTSIRDEYTLRSGITTGATGGWTTGRGRETVEISRKYMQQMKELRPYFYGDYYPLTSTANYTSNAVWLAYQLNRPQQKDGIIIAFRRVDSPETTIRIKPSGLVKDAIYELYYEDYGIRSRQKGDELMNGFDISIPLPPASILIRYRQAD
jgi:alpha-galactosidase